VITHARKARLQSHHHYIYFGETQKVLQRDLQTYG
jgi:hypothetical protein